MVAPFYHFILTLTMKIVTRLLILTVILFSGCLRSLHPLYTEKDLVRDPQLLGTWIEEDGKTFWTFEEGEGKTYELTYNPQGATPESGKTVVAARFKAYLVKLGKYRFLDLFPKDSGPFKNDLLTLHLLPVHTISRVRLVGDSLTLAMLDHDWVKKMIEAKKIKAAFERVGDNQIILTASTPALQKLVVSYAENSGAFPNLSVLHRQK